MRGLLLIEESTCCLNKSVLTYSSPLPLSCRYYNDGELLYSWCTGSLMQEENQPTCLAPPRVSLPACLPCRTACPICRPTLTLSNFLAASHLLPGLPACPSLPVWAFDLEELKWAPLGPKPGQNAPPPRGGHQLALNGDQLFIFGGYYVKKDAPDPGGWLQPTQSLQAGCQAWLLTLTPGLSLCPLHLLYHRELHAQARQEGG